MRGTYCLDHQITLVKFKLARPIDAVVSWPTDLVVTWSIEIITIWPTELKVTLSTELVVTLLKGEHNAQFCMVPDDINQ